MTLNGWLQILLFLAADPGGDAAARAVHDPGVQPRARPGSIRSCDRSSALIYRATGVDETREMRWTEYAAAMLLFSVVSMLRALSDAARAAVAAVEPAGLRRRAAGPGLQHGRVVHHEHELAGLQRRVDDELSDPDGRARVPQLRVGGDRHRAGDRVHPRHRAAGEGHARQLLGRPGPLLAVGAAPVLPGRRAVARLAGRGAEPAPVRQVPSSIRRRHVDRAAGKPQTQS